ncbi:kinase-like domain-containing protein [Cubamyces lactineus]|nr:kinase-like domain-containing protein [Cubamyces lactineus]
MLVIHRSRLLTRPFLSAQSRAASLDILLRRTVSSQFTSSDRLDPEALHTYTTSRWLCNDDLQRRLRITPFDVDALEQAACRSVAARRCISWYKIGEGSFNRVFLLRFDNEAEAAVRIPFPVAGDVCRVTASEVATMCFVHDKWLGDGAQGAPIPPKVLAWNASYDNPAKTPYIITEYAPGVPLLSRWFDIRGLEVKPSLQDIFALESRLLHHAFSRYGSLYFAEDIPDGTNCCWLYADSHSKTPKDIEIAKKYRIGPVASRDWWRGRYQTVDANRGPWPDMKSIIISAAKFQLDALDTIIDLSSTFVKSKPSDIHLLRRLLEICLRAAPSIVPTDPDMTTPVLQHPDLSSSNLIIPAEGPVRITHAIDWQGAAILPFCTQAAMPTAVVYTGKLVKLNPFYPEWPENYDELPPEQQELVDFHHRLACRHVVYQRMVMSGDKVRSKIAHLRQGEPLANLVPQVLRCIADGPQALRADLIRLQENWREFSDDPCPIDFTPDEIAAHNAEQEALDEYQSHVDALYAELRCFEDGSVKTEDYETSKQLMERRREEWDDVAMKGPFPFYEGAHSYFLT